MSIRVNRAFQLQASLNTLAPQIAARWAAFSRVYPDAAAAALDTIGAPAVIASVDPQNLFDARSRHDNTLLSALTLCDLFGSDYVADQLAKHPLTTLVTANRLTFITAPIVHVASTDLGVIASYLFLAARACVELQDLDINTDIGVVAYEEAVVNLINDTGLSENEHTDLYGMLMQTGAEAQETEAAAEVVVDEPDTEIASSIEEPAPELTGAADEAPGSIGESDAGANGDGEGAGDESGDGSEAEDHSSEDPTDVVDKADDAEGEEESREQLESRSE